MIFDHEVIIEGVKIYYKTAGDNHRQLLIFLHGWPGTLSRMGVIEELAKHFYVIAPEHPGLLRSEPLKTYTNIFEQYADVVKNILGIEGLDKFKGIVMGQSFGGAVASAYAEKYPTNTEILILTNSVIGNGKHDLLRKLLFKYGVKLLKISLHLPPFLMKKVLWLGFGLNQGALEDTNLIQSRIAMVDSYTRLITEAVEKDISVLDKKYGNFFIIMLWGDRDGKEFNVAGYCPVDDAKIVYEKLRREGRNVNFLTVSGGHTVLYQKPEMVIGEILKLLPKNS